MSSPDEAVAPIQGLPENAANLDRLLRQLGTGVGLVPFVGAGLSIPLGFPGWPQFLIAQADRAGIASSMRQRIERGEYEEAAGDLLEALGHRAFYDAIEEAFGPARLAGKTIDGAIAVLPKLARGPVVTTNFDRVLETVFAKAERPLEVVWGARVDVTVQSLHEDRRFLLKMHGDAAVRTDRVLTRSEYQEHYGDVDPAKIDWERQLPRALRLILTSRPLLFLGCSLNRDRILAVLRQVAQENPDIAHYAVVEMPPAGNAFHARARDLSEHGIRPIWYPHGRHDAIEPFLSHLAGQTGLKAPPYRSGREERLKPPRLLRKRELAVEDNRRDELARLTSFLRDPTLSVFWLHGLGGIGKSTLARSALEPLIGVMPVAWIACEGQDADQVLARLQSDLNLKPQSLPGPESRPEERIAAILGAIQQPSVVVLDGFEALLDANDGYRSPVTGTLMDTLAGTEHQLKVVVTTRRLPQSVVEGAPGVATLVLRGLQVEKASELFRARARGSLEKVAAIAGTEAFQKLRGHPKWIELLASALGSLPVQQVTTGLLTATDIGQFILSQVMAQLTATELGVVRAASAFRGPFAFDALAAVHASLEPGNDALVQAVRGLVRRDVLESLPGTDTGYYLHPLLREALPTDPEREAAAHAAAAGWFLRDGVKADVLATWDDGLYHLRRAAEVGRGAHVQAYHVFIDDNREQLSYAGWGRRLLEEFKVLTGLTTGGWERFQIRTLEALELISLDTKEAARLLTELNEELSRMRDALPEEEAGGVPGLLAALKNKLASALVSVGEVEQAKRLADEAEALDSSDDPQSRLNASQLRFDIARKSGNQPEMLNLAAEVMHWAEVVCEGDPSPAARDSLAEAHFNLGIASLGDSDLKGFVHHMGEQLRIKLEIGKLSGVAAGLMNVGSLMVRVYPAAAALLLTSEQITEEMGMEPMEALQDQQDPIEKLLADRKKVVEGLALLRSISPRLVPYYERAIARRLGTEAQFPPD